MSFRDELNEILRLSGLPPRLEQLDEAAPSVKRLIPMFQNIIQLAPNMQPRIEQEINWARSVLEREDRIVWYLRLVQLSIMEKMAEDDPTHGTAVEKKINQLAKKAGTTAGQVQSAVALVNEGRRFKQGMAHFLSLPIAAIGNYIFAFEMPQVILDNFEKAEQEWKDDQDRTVPQDPDAEVVIDFGDGYAWYNLNKAHCSKEASAMGHCGNSPRSQSNDNILSLRRTVQVGGESVMTPVLTFILKDDGQLSEMKGRGNDKPAARYHKYIVPLLQHDAVEGIVGGGYMAQNNFSLKDLEDEELRDELLDEKPALAGPLYWLEKKWDEGNYDEAAGELEKLVNSQNLNYPGSMEFDLENAEKGMYAVRVNMGEWDSYEDVIRDYGDRAPESLFKVLEELDEITITEDNIAESMDPEVIARIFELLPADRTAAVAKELGIHGSDQADMAEQIGNLVDSEGENNKYYDILTGAFRNAMQTNDVMREVNALRDRIKERLAAYAKAGIPLRPYQAYLGPKEEGDPLGAWNISMTMQDMMNILAAGMEGGDAEDYDEDGHAFLDWQYDGLSSGEEGHFGSSDHRGEYSDFADMKLDTEGADDTLAKQFDEGNFEITLDSLIRDAASHFHSTLRSGVTPATDTSKQGKLPLEAHRREQKFTIMLEDIRRLAGLS
jgi:hypothetical protein